MLSAWCARAPHWSHSPSVADEPERVYRARQHWIGSLWRGRAHWGKRVPVTDDPTNGEPNSIDPPPSNGLDARQRKAVVAVGTLIVVLVIAVVVLAVALSHHNDHNDATSESTGARGSDAVAAQGTRGPGGVVQVNGGGKAAGPKSTKQGSSGGSGATTSTTTSSDTTTSSSSGDTTTTAGGSSGTGHLSFPVHSIPSFVIINPARLDYQASPSFGEANLSNGFSPDPYSIGMTDGGSVNVSYLGSSCSGFASKAPSLRVNFGGGGASLLRLYFVGTNGDPAMVVNDPFGNFYCVDDSFGTVNPTIDFNEPAGGSYDIWIASAASGTTTSGTLHATSNPNNHP
jgi:hypothetical protein